MWRPLLFILIWIHPLVPSSFVSCQSSLPPRLEREACPTEADDDVVWSTYRMQLNISSKPVCLDANNLIVTRQCIDGEWMPKEKPHCSLTQKIELLEYQIPQFEGFRWLGYSNHTSMYRSRDIAPFSISNKIFGLTKGLDYRTKTSLVGSDYYWLPIRRFRRFYPHVWKIADSWGYVTEEFESLGNDECVVMNYTSSHAEAMDCDKKFPHLGIIDVPSKWIQRTFIKNLNAPIRKYYYIGTQCDEYFRFSEPNDAIIYLRLLNQHSRYIHFNIDPFLESLPSDKLYWVTHLDDANRRSRAQRNRSVCEHTIIRGNPPTLTLSFLKYGPPLQLIVTGGKDLVKLSADYQLITCFTTATDALLENVAVEESFASHTYYDFGLQRLTTVDIYRGNLPSDGPGHYWCEAIGYPDFDIITSNTIIAYRQRSGTTFAFIATHSCKPSCKNQFDKVYLKDVSSKFKGYLNTWNTSVNIADVRVMDIVEADAMAETLLFHVSFEVHLAPDQLKELDCDGGSNDRDWVREVNEVDYVMHTLSSSKPDMGLETFTDVSYNHTMVCVNRTTEDYGAVKLLAARIGERAISSKLCLDENRLMQHRLCDGDFPYGATWGEYTDCGDKPVPRFTQNLYNLVNSEYMCMCDVVLMMEEAGNASKSLNPTDVYLLGRAMRNGATFEIEYAADVFNELLKVDENVAQMSHYFMNGTNTILDGYELLLQKFANQTSIGLFSKDLGVLEIKRSHLMSFIIDPLVAGVRGIALYKTHESDSFESNVEFLFAGLNVTDLMQNNTLESAVYIPNNLWDHLLSWIQTSNHSIRIVVTVMDNPVLFRTDHFEKDRRPVSRIITASIPNFVYKDQLPVLFPIIFRASDHLDYSAGQCVFWQFESSNKTRISEWSNNGCFLLASVDDVHMCGCYHFTNFAFLITGSSHNKHSSLYLSLDVITLSGCTLSLCGIVLIWMTALLFRTWREKEGTRILLHLSCGIALQLAMVVLINIEGILAKSHRNCITVGIIVHYSVLAVFAWMLVTAYLQYMRFIVVLGNRLPKRFFLKAMLVGWLLPCLPIIVICAVDVNLYVPSGIDDFATNICYPQRSALYYGVILPVMTIIVINLIIFMFIIYNITKSLNINKNYAGYKHIHVAQLKLAFLLFFLLGLTWIFGLMVHLQMVTLIATYMFCIFGTMQGFVLFVYFVILDPATRRLWTKYLVCCSTQKNINPAQNASDLPLVVSKNNTTETSELEINGLYQNIDFGDYNAKTCKRVAILARNYPLVRLTSSQMNKILDVIMDKIAEECEGDTKPCFLKCVYRSGYVVLRCENEATRTWVLSIAYQLKPWRGARLHALDVEMIPITVAGDFPNSAKVPSEKILKTIQGQNSDLHAIMWRVMNRTNKGNNARLIFVIDRASVQALEKKNWLISHRFGNVALKKTIRDRNMKTAYDEDTDSESEM